MKPLLFILLASVVLFVTNPDADKHRAKAFDKTQADILTAHGNAEIAPSAMEEAIKSRYIIKDYYLFSLSYSVLPLGDMSLQQLQGVGLLGKVFDVSNLSSGKTI